MATYQQKKLRYLKYTFFSSILCYDAYYLLIFWCFRLNLSCLSHLNERILTCSDDNSIQVWQTKPALQQLFNFGTLENTPTCVACHPNAQACFFILSLYWCKIHYIRDVASSKKLRICKKKSRIMCDDVITGIE